MKRSQKDSHGPDRETPESMPRSRCPLWLTAYPIFASCVTAPFRESHFAKWTIFLILKAVGYENYRAAGVSPSGVNYSGGFAVFDWGGI